MPRYAALLPPALSLQPGTLAATPGAPQKGSSAAGTIATAAWVLDLEQALEQRLKPQLAPDQPLMWREQYGRPVEEGREEECARVVESPPL